MTAPQEWSRIKLLASAMAKYRLDSAQSAEGKFLMGSEEGWWILTSPTTRVRNDEEGKAMSGETEWQWQLMWELYTL